MIASAMDDENFLRDISDEVEEELSFEEEQQAMEELEELRQDVKKRLLH